MDREHRPSAEPLAWGVGLLVSGLAVMYAALAALAVLGPEWGEGIALFVVLGASAAIAGLCLTIVGIARLAMNVDLAALAALGVLAQAEHEAGAERRAESERAAEALERFRARAAEVPGGPPRDED